MPYRIDIQNPPDDILDRLMTVEILDIDASDEMFSALIADGTSPETLTKLLGDPGLQVSPALGRDDDSVWVLRPRPFSVGRWGFGPPSAQSDGRTIALADGRAFGTGLHPTTAMCLELLDSILEADSPDSMLDVGTGSGILALAALQAGVTRVAALDLDLDALRETRRSAQVNALDRGLLLIQGGPAAIGMPWPLVVANILPAVLIDLAPTLAPRVARNGRLVLSGIPEAIAGDVERVYVRCGLRRGWSATRDGWAAVVLTPSW